MFLEKMSSFFAGAMVFILALGAFSQPAWAVEVPAFPSCANPQGIVKVHYDNGTHGIVGDMKLYQGKDTVYQITADTLTQCFCSTDEMGIQTNWWKLANLSEEDINTLRLDGWVLIPDGSVWGLDAGPYLAKNISSSCKTSSNSSGSSSNGNNSSGSTSDGTGNALGASTARIGSVLGFAVTGNMLLILLSSALGVYLLLLWLVLRKRAQEENVVAPKKKKKTG